jgi:arylsulfatase A-like enzyme
MEEPSVKLDPGFRTLADRLLTAGYRTGAYYGNGLVGPMFGLDRGYEVSELHNDDDIREDEARKFLDRIGNGAPFLLYLHTMEPHQPYLAPYEYIRPFGHVSIEQKVRIDDDWTDYAALKRVGPVDRTAELDRMVQRLNDVRPTYELLYDASVLQADANLKKVIDLLKARNLWDTVLFIVVADHGEEFGEHGVWLHKESVYDAVMRVPLIIHFPRSAFAGLRVREVVSLVDVAPTILDYIGQGQRCEGCRGRSLLPVVAGATQQAGTSQVPGLRMNTTTYYRRVREQRGDVNVVVRQGRWKGIWNQQPGVVELYDLDADPQEQTNLSATSADRVAQLRDHAAQWFADCRAALRAPQATELDDRTRQNLRALGYIN